MQNATFDSSKDGWTSPWWEVRRTCNLHKHSTATMVSKMTVARTPPAMTTVPADIRNPLHQQPAGRAQTVTEATHTWEKQPSGLNKKEILMLFTGLGRQDEQSYKTGTRKMSCSLWIYGFYAKFIISVSEHVWGQTGTDVWAHTSFRTDAVLKEAWTSREGPPHIRCLGDRDQNSFFSPLLTSCCWNSWWVWRKTIIHSPGESMQQISVTQQSPRANQQAGHRIQRPRSLEPSRNYSVI